MQVQVYLHVCTSLLLELELIGQNMPPRQDIRAAWCLRYLFTSCLLTYKIHHSRSSQCKCWYHRYVR